jgi:uncharacterized protein (DUF1778 family)
MAERTRDEVIAFRVTPSERRQIKAKIRKSGLSQREYLLRAALDQPIYVVEELKPLLAELRGQGKNLNQLTVLAHEGYIQTVDMSDMVNVLEKVYGAICALLTERDTVITHGDV